MTRPFPFPLLRAAVVLAAITTAPTMARGQSPSNAMATAGAEDLGQHPLFANITLDAAQRSQIAAIRTRFKAQAAVEQDSMRRANTAAFAATQRHDNGAATSAKARADGYRSRLVAMLADERDDMRRVLAAGQQKTFDANLAEEHKLEQAAQRAP